MRFCQPHWDSLRAAIAARGLSALVADSGDKAAANLASEVEHGRTIDNYDPLMAAHWAIVNNAMDMAGLVIMTEDICPLCYLNEQSRASWERGLAEGMKPGEPCPCPDVACAATFPAEPSSYDVWIDRAADDQVEVWKSMGAAT
jgi:hypothetical protein